MWCRLFTICVCYHLVHSQLRTDLGLLRDKINCGQNAFTRHRAGETSEKDDSIIDYPWMVSAGYQPSASHWVHVCGGSLVAPETVLTAAHCVHHPDIKEVRLGDVDLKSGVDNAEVKRYDITERYTHPKYEPNSPYYDVGLWHFDKVDLSPPHNEKISTVCIPEKSTTDLSHNVGLSVTLTGWGKKNRTTFNDGKLKEIPIKIYSHRFCNRTHSDSTFKRRNIVAFRTLPYLFQSTLLCAGYESENGNGACEGDSGSPIVEFQSEEERFVQIGIVQGGLGECGDPTLPAIFVRLEDAEIYDFVSLYLNTPIVHHPELDPEITRNRFSVFLYRGAKSGDVEFMKTYLETDFLNADIDSQGNENGETALHAAARLGHVEAVEFLVNYNADIYRMDNDGFTPMHLAMFKGREEVLMLFINHDENVLLMEDDLQRSLLWHASQRGLHEMAEILIEKGSNVHSVSADSQTPFNAAVYNGHINVTKVFLDKEENFELNFPQADGFYPLIYAAKGNRVAMGEFLIGVGANVTLSRQNGSPLLSRAIFHRSKEFIKFLIGIGANIEEKSDAGNTPLQFACFLGDLEIVKLLIERGNAKVNIPTASLKQQPLYDAAKRGHLDVMLYLLSKGAEIKADEDLINQVIIIGNLEILKLILDHTQRDLVISTEPFHYATFKNQSNIVKHFINNYNVSVDLRNHNNETALMFAALYGNVYLCEYLIDRGASIEAENKDGFRALNYAASYGHNDVVTLLLDKGANIEAQKNNDGETPLHGAAKNGRLEVVEILLDRGAAIDTKRWQKHGETALFLASQFQWFSTGVLLIDRGADPNVVESKFNFTALHYCAEMGGFECVRRLVQAGANVEAKRNDGWTPLFGAVSANQNEIVRFLVEKTKVDVNVASNIGQHPILLAVLQRNPATVRILVENGAKVDVIDGLFGATPLQLAVELGDYNVVQYLVLTAKADVNLINKKGFRALHNAVIFGRLNVVKLLVKHGQADIEAPGGKFDITPLFFAVLNNHLDVAEYLLQNGANVNSVNRAEGDTPLSVAASSGFLEMIKLLQKFGAKFS